MARTERSSAAHALGEAIGKTFEDVAPSYAKPIIEECGYYYDYKHPRPARNGNVKVVWEDINGNEHAFDFVAEEGGSEYEIGLPGAFIEVAWRKFSKHSKNKAQEISGAVLKVIDRYAHLSPFAGVILAGDFTDPALAQMRSEGFTVLYFPYDMIVGAFRTRGIDIEYDDSTTVREIKRRTDAIQAFSEREKREIAEYLRMANSDEVEAFERKLRHALSRKPGVYRVHVLYSDGIACFDEPDAACRYISSSPTVASGLNLTRFEVVVEFDNGDHARSSFSEPEDAIRFIRMVRGANR